MSYMPKQFPPEVREQAVRLMRDHAGDYPSEAAAIRSIAPKCGVGVESLRRWYRQAKIDDGQVTGTSSDDKAKLAELERKVAELERANAILKAAATFFAAELDRPQP